MTDAELEQRIAAGLPIADIDFRGRLLSGLVLTGGTFLRCHFETARFDGCLVDGTTFVECAFDGAVVSCDEIANVTFLRSSFREATLVARSSSATTFAQCHLACVDWRVASTTTGRFIQASLLDVTLRGATFERTLFLLTDHPAVIERCRFDRVVLDGLDASKTRLIDVVAERSVFGRAELCGADFASCTFRYCQFQGARVVGSRFDGVDLTGSAFLFASIELCSFAETVLESASFHRATVADSDFAGAARFRQFRRSFAGLRGLHVERSHPRRDVERRNQRNEVRARDPRFRGLRACRARRLCARRRAGRASELPRYKVDELLDEWLAGQAAPYPRWPLGG